jgi:hypothetical protein
MINDTYPIDKIKRAIKGSLGQIGTIARRLGVERSLIVDYLNRYPELLYSLACEEEDKKDAIEIAFLEQIKKGNVPCILHAIKTLCKDRGYSENISIKPTQLQLFQTKTEYDLGKLTDDELEQLERINKKLES